jgi:hypothetical protein
MKRPKPPKKIDPGMVAGITWYREVDWPRVKRLFPDADKLHDTYAGWLKSAETMMERLRRQGVAAEPFMLDIDDFLAWCLVEGHHPDAKARSQYVSHKLHLKYNGPEQDKP